MTSETQAPERIWIDNERYEQRWHVLADGCQPPVDYPHVFGQYTRTDLVAAKDARIAELERLLRRYRAETPLGHQPHMIAHEVDAALSRKGELQE